MSVIAAMWSQSTPCRSPNPNVEITNPARKPTVDANARTELMTPALPVPARTAK